jgi:hypothetical protein
MNPLKYFVALSATLLSCVINAQSNEKSITLPSTPAFSILNFDPSAVMRPTSTEQLKTDLLNSFDKDGKLLMNLGIEFQPYWLQNRPGLTRKEYLHPTGFGGIIRSLSISGATVKDSSTGNNNFGLGLRFRVLHGRPTDSVAYYDSALAANDIPLNVLQDVRLHPGNYTKASIKSLIDAAVTNKVIASKKQGEFVKKKIDELGASHPDDETGIAALYDELETALDKAGQAAQERLAAIQEERKGLTLDFAGAVGFEKRPLETRRRIGVWGNLNYMVSPDDFFTLTGRAFFSNGDTSQQNLDVGLAFTKKAQTFNVSLEGLVRYYDAKAPDPDAGPGIKKSEHSFTYRFALQASYLLTKNISLNLTIGKDFDKAFVNASSFLSIFGFNYTIFNRQDSREMKAE